MLRGSQVARIGVLLAALSLLACLQAPPAGAARPSEITLQGKLGVAHYDDFKQGRYSTSYSLMTKNAGRVPLLFPDEKPPSTMVGSATRVKGIKRDRRLRVRKIRRLHSAHAASSTVPLGVKKIAVIMVTFHNDPNNHPWDEDFARETVFTGADSTNSFYQEDSAGRLSLTGKYRADGDVFGWYEIPQDNQPCATSDWVASARQKAQADLATQGKDLSGYDHLLIVSPSSSCVNAGGSSLDAFGTYSICSGYFANWCVGHEFGHWLGLFHANGYSCKSNGQWVAMSDQCSSLAYHDPFDIMGVPGTDYQNNNLHKAQLDFLTGNIEPVTHDDVYTLEPSEPGFTGTQMLEIPRTATPTGADTDYFYLDFRQPNGFFDDFLPDIPTATTGVAIRIAADHQAPGTTNLVDTNPNTGTYPYTEFRDAPLALGNTFEDPTTGIRITTQSYSAAGASVKIHLPGAEVRDSTLSYRARAGEVNDVTVSGSAGDYTITDRGVPAINLGDGCDPTPDPQTVTCQDPGIDAIAVDAGDLNNQVRVLSDTPATLKAGFGKDVLSGGGGDDRLDGGYGTDVLSGGGGVDTVEYADRNFRLKVDLDGRRDDGQPGERDTVGADVENITGGNANDVLTGNKGPNALLGGDGKDRLKGDDGDDSLDGGAGSDILFGGRGNDTLLALDGERDTLNCGLGSDPFPARDPIDIVHSC